MIGLSVLHKMRISEHVSCTWSAVPIWSIVVIESVAGHEHNAAEYVHRWSIILLVPRLWDPLLRKNETGDATFRYVA